MRMVFRRRLSRASTAPLAGDAKRITSVPAGSDSSGWLGRKPLGVVRSAVHSGTQAAVSWAERVVCDRGELILILRLACLSACCVA